MISADRLAAYAVMSFLLIIIPGPSVLFVIGRALAHGRRAALVSTAGNTTGTYLPAVAAHRAGSPRSAAPEGRP
jgi:threonine/homoserine/homoserine lactone efflux protein